MRLGLLWALAVASGAVAALVLYDSVPGINWTAWTVLTVAGLVAVRQPDSATRRAMALPLGFAVVLSVGAAVTTTEPILVVIVAMVASLLALAVVIAADGDDAEDYGAVAILTVPIKGLWQTIRGATALAADTAKSAGGTEQRPVLRGVMMAVPVVVILALLFASADPLLARGRDMLQNSLSTFDALPRVIFGLVVAIFVASAYYSSRFAGRRITLAASSARADSEIGVTERQIVLGAAAAISWLFVLLQISYLFGKQPSTIGSGITFADYARRGFGELCVAATGVALLIAAAHQRIPPRDQARAHKSLVWPSLALLGAECCVIFSAFHRVSLYEGAYGYTTSRVYAQAYMIITLLVLVALARHVLRDFRVRKLAREVMTIALATLVVLVFWSADAWVARANIARYAATGKLDVAYLGDSLSPDAYPALVESLPKLVAADRGTLVAKLAKHYASREELKESPAWYEWNLRRSAARRLDLPEPKVKTVTE
ncbi:MAG: DUF4173 domain-containing protein [Gemmatimonadaceae bacterium]